MIQHEAAAFDPDYLKRMSNQNRKKLNNDPADLSSRLSLAWHLFFQAHYYKQHQLFWKGLLNRSEPQDEMFHRTLETMYTETLESVADPRRILKECLLQAAMVQQLSADAGERSEASRIERLATMMGEDQTIEEVKAESNKILGRLARAIFSEKREKTRLASHRRDLYDDSLEDF